MAGIFARDKIDGLERFYRPIGQVGEVTDRGCDQIEYSGHRIQLILSDKEAKA